MYRFLEQCTIPVDIYEYNPIAKDDLIYKFSNIFSSKNSNELQKLTGLKKNVVEKLKEIVESNRINNLIQLTKIKGIGEETIKVCFQFTLSYRIQPAMYSQEIFPTSVVSEDPINPTNLIHKKKIVKRSSLKKRELLLEEKILITGLDEKTILKIESKSEDITISDLRKYCRELKLNFKSYFVKNFTSSTNKKKEKLKGETSS
jgi:hypothetical protein